MVSLGLAFKLHKINFVLRLHLFHYCIHKLNITNHLDRLIITTVPGTALSLGKSHFPKWFLERLWATMGQEPSLIEILHAAYLVLEAKRF